MNEIQKAILQAVIEGNESDLINILKTFENVNFVDEKENSPLFYAAMRRNEVMVELLLKKGCKKIELYGIC